ncbi:MAG: hypothetical protein Q9171_006342 [Xanthocarpia ochracea]
MPTSVTSTWLVPAPPSDVRSRVQRLSSLTSEGWNKIGGSDSAPSETQKLIQQVLILRKAQSVGQQVKKCVPVGKVSGWAIRFHQVADWSGGQILKNPTQGFSG